MFIASKYEEIDPLFVGTIVMRIGKNKYSLDTILNKEKEILNVLRFKLNAVPTVLEFVERYLSHEYFKAYIHGDQKLNLAAKYMACLQAHQARFAVHKASEIAFTCISLAHEICHSDMPDSQDN